MAEHYPVSPVPFPLTTPRSSTLNGGDGGLTHSLWSNKVDDALADLLARLVVAKFTFNYLAIGSFSVMAHNLASVHVQCWVSSGQGGKSGPAVVQALSPTSGIIVGMPPGSWPDGAYTAFWSKL